MFSIGVDVGGTNLRAIRVARGTRIEARVKRPTEAALGWPAVACAIAEAVRKVAGGKRPAAIGIAVPGAIDDARGIVTESPNIPGGPDFPLARTLRKLFRGSSLRGTPLAIENDANAAAWGEFRFGAGRGCNHMVLLTLGTGIGGGIVVSGRLHRGADGTAGEIGHVVVRAEGARCPCGRHGCLEAYCAANALVRSAGRIAKTPADLARLADRGNSRAREAFRRYGQNLGIAIASILNLLNPERIVLAGGISNELDLFGPTLKAEACRRAFALPGRRALILKGTLGDDAGALGAAALAGI